MISNRFRLPPLHEVLDAGRREVHQMSRKTWQMRTLLWGDPQPLTTLGTDLWILATGCVGSSF
jgi:hypothetical protein